MTGHVARAEVTVAATPAQVWRVLTAPGARPELMLGAETVTDWQVGSPIVWRGEWHGTPFEDKGEVLEVVPGRRLAVTHYSPLGGQPDEPASYHRVIWTLEEASAPGAADGEPTTVVRLEQDNNATPEAAAQSSEHWATMLEGLRTVTERERSS